MIGEALSRALARAAEGLEAGDAVAALPFLEECVKLCGAARAAGVQLPRGSSPCFARSSPGPRWRGRAPQPPSSAR